MAGKVKVGLASHWSCVTDFTDLSTYGLEGLRKGDDHATYTCLRSTATFTFTVISGATGAIFLTGHLSMEISHRTPSCLPIHPLNSLTTCCGKCHCSLYSRLI